MNHATGITGNDYRYQHDRWSAGPAYRYRDDGNTMEFLARAGYGQVKDKGHIEPEGGKYRGKQKADIVHGFVSYEDRSGIAVPAEEWTEWNNRTVYHALADVQVQAKKEASWTDSGGRKTKLDEEPSNVSMVNVGVDHTLYSIDQKQTAALVVGAGGTYYFDRNMARGDISVGPDFWDRTVMVRGSASLLSDGTTGVGVGVGLNLTNAVRKIFNTGSAGQGTEFTEPLSNTDNIQGMLTDS
jgi:hypothetical protein